MRRYLLVLPPLLLLWGTLDLTAQAPTRANATQPNFSNTEPAFFIANNTNRDTHRVSRQRALGVLFLIDTRQKPKPNA